MDFLNNLFLLKEAYNQDFMRLNFMDIADKLTWKTTTHLLVILNLILFYAKEFLNKPISCAVPMYFSSNQEEYTNEICFITNKYSVNDNQEIFFYKDKNETSMLESFLNFNENLSKNSQSRVNGSFYLWLPYILILQGFSFLFPEKLWYFFLNVHTKIDIRDLLKASSRIKNTIFSYSSIKKDPYFKYFIQNLSYEILGLKCSKKLFYTYLFVKFFNITLVIGNIYMIHVLLEINSFNFIINISYNFMSIISKRLVNSVNISNEHHIYANYFPLKTLCFFQVRELGSINHSYAVMCALPLNILIQYLFLFLFMWYVIIIIIQICFIIRFFNHYSISSRNMFTKKCLIKIFKRESKYNKISDENLFFDYVLKLVKKQNQIKLNSTINAFNEFITIDFIFLLNIIETNITKNSNNIDNYFIENILFYYFEIFSKFYFK